MSYGNYPSLENVKKALVIKLRHHGDVLLTSPLFTVLKDTLAPDAQIDAYIYHDTLSMLSGHPAITQFHTYDKKWKKLSFLRRLIREMQLLRQIRKGRYDLVINLTEGDRGAIVAKTCGASIRVGVDPGEQGMKGKKKYYTHIVKNCSTPRHTVERNLDALRRIGIFPAEEKRDLFLHIPEEDKPNLQDYIVVHPVSRWRFKCPPTSFTADLIDALHKRGEKIVLTASPDPDELAMCQDLAKRSSGSRPIGQSAHLCRLRTAPYCERNQDARCRSLRSHLGAELGSLDAPPSQGRRSRYALPSLLPRWLRRQQKKRLPLPFPCPRGSPCSRHLPKQVIFLPQRKRFLPLW
jgi:heptosyltransferase-3